MRRGIIRGRMLAEAPPPALHAEIVGRSVRGRTIRLVHVGDPDAPGRVLVVGCIHGTEHAGEAITHALRRARPPRGVQLLVLDELNPDGCAAGTRGNAHGVDLNRNFPERWRPLSGLYASGPRPRSEPETRAAQRLITRERPTITIWFHQHMDRVILERGADRTIMRRYARIAHLRTRVLAPLPGTATGWQQHTRPQATAFVVELPAGALTAAAVRAHVRAVLAVAKSAVIDDAS